MAADEKPAKPAAREKIPAGHQVVIVSMTPDTPLLVTDAEHTDLEAQGLLLESTKEGARLRQVEEN